MWQESEGTVVSLGSSRRWILMKIHCKGQADLLMLSHVLFSLFSQLKTQSTVISQSCAQCSCKFWSSEYFDVSLCPLQLSNHMVQNWRANDALGHVKQIKFTLFALQFGDFVPHDCSAAKGLLCYLNQLGTLDFLKRWQMTWIYRRAFLKDNN